MSDEHTRRQIVDTLARIAIDEVVEGEASTLRDPPGRQPRIDLVARSEWFNALPEDEQSIVIDVMRQTAYGTLHRILVALDGATAVGDGRLGLTWNTEESVVELTGVANERVLHDLLAERAGP